MPSLFAARVLFPPSSATATLAFSTEVRPEIGGTAGLRVWRNESGTWAGRALLFPKSNLKPGERAPWDKRARNGIYLLCGVAMVVCVLWALGAWLMDGPIFWPEALALEFFAVSWLAKGRADRTAINAGRRTLHYARHPGELVHRATNTIRR